MTISDLKPAEALRAYDLLRQAGLVTEVPPEDAAHRLGAHRTYLSRWSFIEGEQIVFCLWHHDLRADGDIIFQRLNYRKEVEDHRDWSDLQKKRAWAMDRAFVTAHNQRLSLRVIIVDGPEDENGDRTVERRSLDPERWHIATYDSSTGWCRLQRGPKPIPLEKFTPAEVTTAGTFNEGALGDTTTKTRERSARLRDLVRDHFAKQSSDGRLHCAVCDWAPPQALSLTGPIVEIHHGLGISQYPDGGRALTFEEAIQHLAPLCPNCHRIAHARPGGGTFSLLELRQARI